MAIDKPSTPYPGNPGLFQSPMPSVLPDPSIKGESFDQLIRNRGVRFIHKKATACPNLTSLEGRGHEPGCTVCDDVGLLFYKEHEIVGVLFQNSLERMFEIQGVWESGVAVVTFPTEYPDGNQADFMQFDKLIMPDFQVRQYELIEFKPNSLNIQRLRYDVIRIDYMAYASGNQLFELKQGIDFDVEDGVIKWIPGRQPAYDTVNKRGKVLTISYVTNPQFNVVQMMHEIRATQELVGGTKVARRLPQQVLIKRDFLTRSRDKVDGT